MNMNHNYEAWSLGSHSKASFYALSPREKCEYLIAIAHLAPSTHNTQPWRFKIEKDLIDIFIDRNTILSASDKNGRQTAISVGCAMENLIVAANYFAFLKKINIRSIEKKELIHDPNTSKKQAGQNNIHIGSIQIGRNEKTNTQKLEDLFSSIFTRKVTRAEFNETKDVSKTVERDLIELNTCKDLNVHIVKDKIRKKAVSEFQGQADSFVMNSKKFSVELGSWLLPNDTCSYIGMPGTGFGLNDDQALRIHSGLLRKTPLEPEDALRFALAGKNHIEKSPMLIFITTKNDSVQQLVNAGRILQRCMLYLESKGIQSAIYAGISEVSLINRMFSVSLGVKDKIAILFRAGYAKNPEDLRRPHSPRAPLKKIIL